MKEIGAIMVLGLLMFAAGFGVGSIVGYATPKSTDRVVVRDGPCCQEYLDHIAAERRAK